MTALPLHQEVLPEDELNAPGVLPGAHVALLLHQEKKAPRKHKRGRLTPFEEPESGGKRQSLQERSGGGRREDKRKKKKEEIGTVFKEYFKELEEESIRDNFVTVYELLDELMDFGFPQTTDSKILQEYITQQGHKLEVGAPRPPATVTNAVSWRSEGIKYRKNEVFIDVIESVNLLVSANGSVLRSEIVGSIKLKVVLSGMPELRLGLNDKVLFEITGRDKSKSVELEDVKFHQCVRLSRFENDRTISFIPPDGESELMSYRLNTHVKPLFWIESVIEKYSHSRVEIMVKAKSQFKQRSTANNVEIMVPVPSDADSPKFKTSTGSAKWVPEKNVVVWTIKSFPGGKEFLMRAHFGLPSVESEELEGKPPITVNFEIPYFTVSGIQNLTVDAIPEYELDLCRVLETSAIKLPPPIGHSMAESVLGQPIRRECLVCRLRIALLLLQLWPTHQRCDEVDSLLEKHCLFPSSKTQAATPS
ncbi:AP1M1 protein, partial [Polypterus senegalus]